MLQIKLIHFLHNSKTPENNYGSANLLKGFRRSGVGRTDGSRWFESLEGCGRQAGPVAKQEFLLNGSLGNKATTLTTDLIRSGSHYSVLRAKEKSRCYLGI